jgi:hypothetical protein
MESTRYPGVYDHETKAATRDACTYRGAGGRRSFKRGFASLLAASKAKGALDVRARKGAGRLPDHLRRVHERIDDAVPARRLGERAVDEDDCGSHDKVPFGCLSAVRREWRCAA